LRRHTAGFCSAVDIRKSFASGLTPLFVLFDAVTKGSKHVARTDPPTMRIISDKRFRAPYQRSVEVVTILGWSTWLAREI
jgi:hypothetical protein